MQKKHAKKFSIKNFGAPKTPPLEILYVGLLLVFKGKRGLKHKEFAGSGVPLGGGLGGGGVLPKFFLFMPFFGS